jgi:hypothetical protein
MIRFPYKVYLTLPERTAKSDLNKTIMDLRPASYKIHNLSFVQFEWEFKSSIHRDNIVDKIKNAVSNLPPDKFAISILDV